MRVVALTTGADQTPNWRRRRTRRTRTNAISNATIANRKVTLEPTVGRRVAAKKFKDLGATRTRTKKGQRRHQTRPTTSSLGLLLTRVKTQTNLSPMIKTISKTAISTLSTMSVQAMSRQRGRQRGRALRLRSFKAYLSFSTTFPHLLLHPSSPHCSC